MEKQGVQIEAKLAITTDLDERVKLERDKGNLEEMAQDQRNSVAPDYKQELMDILEALNKTRERLPEISRYMTILDLQEERGARWLAPTLFISLSLTFLFGIFAPLHHEFFGFPDARFTFNILYVTIPLFLHIVSGLCAYALLKW